MFDFFRNNKVPTTVTELLGEMDKKWYDTLRDFKSTLDKLQAEKFLPIVTQSDDLTTVTFKGPNVTTTITTKTVDLPDVLPEGPAGPAGTAAVPFADGVGCICIINVEVGPGGRIVQNQEFVNPGCADYSSTGGGAGTALNPNFTAGPETGLSGTWRWLGRQWYHPGGNGNLTITGPAVKIG